MNTPIRTPVHKRPCGFRECSSSTHKNEYRTFGRGSLDQDGFWEIPCRVCAAQADEERQTIIDQARISLKHVYVEEEAIERYINDTRWLHNLAWPFAEVAEDNSLEPELAMADSAG